METLDTRMVGAWKEAASDLGIRFVSPFATDDKKSRAVEVEGYLPDFGGPSGMVFASFSRRIRFGSAKLYASVLFEGYRNYDRKLFVETLNDWGWFGPKADRPIWYSGEHW